MMNPKIVAVPDSFKGTMSSMTVCDLIEQAARQVFPDPQVVKIPVADGGEGSVDSFLAAVGGERVEARVSGPFGPPVDAFYGVLPDGTAVIELAACAGLPLAGPNPDPERTTTFGVGELMLHAWKRGVRRFYCCLGGSATNDGGCGAAAACGIRFLDAVGNAFVPTGGTLDRVAAVDPSGYRLRGAEIITVCDVDNPFCGPEGAAYVFAPQKGADGEMCRRLDAGLAHLADVLRRDLGADLSVFPGAGAAGGMGGGNAAFFGSVLRPGIEVVLDAADFDRRCADASLVLTGEGRLDAQSLRGKVPVGVARRCRRLGVPCAALTGEAGDGAELAYGEGLCGIFGICRVAAPFEQQKRRSQRNLLETAVSLLTFWKAVSGE